MNDENTLRDEIAALRNDVGQLRGLVQDLHTVLLGPTGTATAHESAFDPKRIIGEGARAFAGGLTTSPYREGAKEEHWWRFGWELARDATKRSRGEW